MAKLTTSSQTYDAKVLIHAVSLATGGKTLDTEGLVLTVSLTTSGNACNTKGTLKGLTHHVSLTNGKTHDTKGLIYTLRLAAGGKTHVTAVLSKLYVPLPVAKDVTEMIIYTAS